MEDQGRRRTQRRPKRAKNQERVKNQKARGREVGGREVRLGAGKVLGRGGQGRGRGAERSQDSVSGTCHAERAWRPALWHVKLAPQLAVGPEFLWDPTISCDWW